MNTPPRSISHRLLRIVIVFAQVLAVLALLGVGAAGVFITPHRKKA